MNAEIKIVKFDVADVITTSGGSCSIKGQLVEECDFE